MKFSTLLFYIITTFLVIFISCDNHKTSENEGSEEPFMEIQQLFDDERFPNVVVATDGSVLTSFGGTGPSNEGHFKIRRSEDGGESWTPTDTIAAPIYWHGGGTVVDENSGDIMLFAERHPFTDQNPSGELLFLRSWDHGETWAEEEVVIHPDENGYYPAMHINERGITLQHGPHAGRLLKATRVMPFAMPPGNAPENWDQHYTNAMYSDDGGRTWHSSAPFPAKGTGEAALEELSDGTIYYNSRRHLSTDGLNPRMRHIAWSYDGGESWEDLSVSDVLPDGAQNRDYGLMAGLVRLPVEEQDILIYSNIDSDEGRVRGTVWASFDGGKTWPVNRLVDEGPFAYSSLAAGRPGTPSEGYIYLLYEGRSGANIARFNLSWITEGRDWKEFLEDE
ncbi:sialidase family protein [soil metagenome]